MAAVVAPTMDPNATGPRSWPEYAAMRAAHDADPEHPPRARADAIRLDAIVIGRKARADAALLRAKPQQPASEEPQEKKPKKATEADRAAAKAAANADQEAARLDTIAALPRVPCSAPRCTGHVDPNAPVILAEIERQRQADEAKKHPKKPEAEPAPQDDEPQDVDAYDEPEYADDESDAAA